MQCKTGTQNPNQPPPIKTRAASLRSGSGPNNPRGGALAHASGPSTLTTASLARHVNVSSAPSPPFGSNTSRLPSTMAGASRRVRRASVEEVEDEGDLPSQASTEYTSAPPETRSPSFFSAPKSAVPVAAHTRPSPRAETATLGSSRTPPSSMSELTAQSSDKREQRSPPSSVDAHRDHCGGPRIFDA
ncbi:hypothetical protein DFH09DRAFT_1107808 [Mycena vulgaris]|nr:hypothetical protein DFH09DRAFT_1107808 [Mycena vulgaris]